jgi:hypothetical protein
MAPTDVSQSQFSAEDYLCKFMRETPFTKPILFVLDNFETVRSPGDLYSWLDNQIRIPNKILITTRTREFKGDYPVEVDGMTESESRSLIAQVSKHLGIEKQLNKQRIDRLIEESLGHPYVIRIMLGEIGKRKKTGKVENVFAGMDDVLEALFDRTYTRLSPAAKRLFLTLCSWRSSVPKLALEAVLLSHASEKMDVHDAIRELELCSLVEITTGPEGDASELVSVPLIAAVFGARKLKVSELRTSIKSDTALLQGFGPVQSSYVRLGIAPSIERMFRNVARKIEGNNNRLMEYRGMLELICRRYPPAWLYFAALYEDIGDYDKAIQAVKKYIEVTEEESGLRVAWDRLERLCQKAQDWSGEIQAVVEKCKLPDTSFEAISGAALKINKSLKEHFSAIEIDEKAIIVDDMIMLIESRIDEAEANDLSRLAWLYLNRKNSKKALDYAIAGLATEPENPHCRGIFERLNRKLGDKS